MNFLDHKFYCAEHMHNTYYMDCDAFFIIVCILIYVNMRSVWYEKVFVIHNTKINITVIICKGPVGCLKSGKIGAFKFGYHDKILLINSCHKQILYAIQSTKPQPHEKG